MNWSDLKAVIGGAAPLLGTVIGGPAGAMVGGIVSAALGTANTPDAVSAALLGNPDALVKIRQIESDNQVQLQQLVVTAEANRLLDVQSARTRQSANPNDRTPQYLAWGVSIGFFAVLTLVMFAHMEGSVQSLLLVMTGALQSAWMAIISYYFGSSKDSAGKTQMIADIGNAAASAPINIQAPATMSSQETTTTTVQTPVSSPQNISVSPAHDEQSTNSAPSAQGNTYQGGS